MRFTSLAQIKPTKASPVSPPLPVRLHKSGGSPLYDKGVDQDKAPVSPVRSLLRLWLIFGVGCVHSHSIVCLHLMCPVYPLPPLFTDIYLGRRRRGCHRGYFLDLVPGTNPSTC